MSDKYCETVVQQFIDCMKRQNTELVKNKIKCKLEFEKCIPCIITQNNKTPFLVKPINVSTKN